MSATASITRNVSGLYELTLHGRMAHPHWVAFLFTGLAESKISVFSGRAIQTDIQQWHAQFMLDFARSPLAPEGVDYVALSERKASAVDMAPPQISKFEVLRLADQGLEVRIEGPDQIGFLSRLLGRLALVMLFPTEIEITTVRDRVRDRLVFHGIGGAPPDENAKVALETMLRGFVTA